MRSVLWVHLSPIRTRIEALEGPRPFLARELIHVEFVVMTLLAGIDVSTNHHDLGNFDELQFFEQPQISHERSISPDFDGPRDLVLSGPDFATTLAKVRPAFIHAHAVVLPNIFKVSFEPVRLGTHEDLALSLKTPNDLELEISKFCSLLHI